MFPFRTRGISNVDDEFGEYKALVERLDDEYDDALDQAFPDEWAQCVTGFSSFQAFIDAGFEEYDSVTEFPEDELDAWVDGQSGFDGWDDLLEAGGNAWIKREF